MNIMDYFPYETPRPGQILVLNWLAENWNNYDVFVIMAPVSAGKSSISVTLARWAYDTQSMDTSIMTPTNVLVNQYKREFKLPVLPRVNQFASKDLFNQAKIEFKSKPTKLMNNMALLANRAYGSVQIFDEAHTLIPMLQDFEGLKVWQHLDPYPDDLKTVADVLMWAASLGPKSTLGKKLVKLLSVNPSEYVINHEYESYFSKMQKCLRVYPLTPKNNKPILWPPSKVKKMVLMSGTIARPDVLDLGLANRRIGYIEIPSDINPDNRPVFITDCGSMSRNNARVNLGKCLDQIQKIQEFHGERGFIHSTYGLAGEIPDPTGRGLVVHNKFNKDKLLREWLGKTIPGSFVGCGLTTGLDLKFDLCKWQAILKCPFPDLGDPAVSAKANNNPDWYAWATIKQLVQAYGRVCRDPEDYGETFILDSDFKKLLEKNRHLFPKYFLEAIK